MNLNDTADILGGEDGQPFPKGPDLLTGTTGEDSTSALLETDTFATLRVGKVAIRYALKGTIGVATSVAATDRYLPAGAEITWRVAPNTRGVYVERDVDATGTYEVWVWQSSP